MASTYQQQMQQCQQERQQLEEEISALEKDLISARSELHKLARKLVPEPRMILRKRWEVGVVNKKIWEKVVRPQAPRTRYVMLCCVHYVL